MRIFKTRESIWKFRKTRDRFKILNKYLNGPLRAWHVAKLMPFSLFPFPFPSVFLEAIACPQRHGFQQSPHRLSPFSLLSSSLSLSPSNLYLPPFCFSFFLSSMVAQPQFEPTAAHWWTRARGDGLEDTESLGITSAKASSPEWWRVQQRIANWASTASQLWSPVVLMMVHGPDNNSLLKMVSFISNKTTRIVGTYFCAKI